MALVNFTIDQQTLLEFGRRFRAGKQRQLRIAISNIRREWQSELVRQQESEGDGTWPGWSTRGKNSYFDQRQREERTGRPTYVKYYTLLKRTGKMMDGYIKGIRPDYDSFGVSMNYPRGIAQNGESLTKIAKIHQGEWIQTKGNHPPRPFKTDRFTQVAIQVITAAVKSDPRNGPYKGFNK